MKRFVPVLPAIGLVLGLWMPSAGATPFDVSITSPSTVTQVAPGGTVDVSVQFSETHVCGSYFSTIYIGGVATPLVQQEFEYVPGVDIPNVCGGPTRTHNFTHALTIPANAPEGLYDIDAFFDEDYFGTRCCGSFAATRLGVIQVVIPVLTTTGDCKNGGWRTYTNPTFKNQGDCVSYVATKGKNPPAG